MRAGDIIKSLRLGRGMTQKALGNQIGVSELSVRCWESGTKNPSLGAIVSLAELFNVSADYILGISDKCQDELLLLSVKERTLLTNYRCLDLYGKRMVETVCSMERNRIVNTSKGSTKSEDGSGRYISHYYTPSAAGYSTPLDGDDYEMITVDDTTPKDADFAVTIRGQSMLPHIKDGDVVFVKRDAELEAGDVGIFSVDGAMYCKQYYRDSSNNLILVSANPDYRNTNVVMGAESTSSIKCYGKVLLGHKIPLPTYLP